MNPLNSVGNSQNSVAFSDLTSNGIAAPIDQKVAEYINSNPEGFPFSLNGNDYVITRDSTSGNYQLYEKTESGPVLKDDNVQLSSPYTPEGSIELSGISEDGTRVYLAEVPGGEVVALTADHDLNSEELDSLLSFNLASAPNGTYFVDEKGQVTDIDGNPVGINKDVPQGQYMAQNGDLSIVIDGRLSPATIETFSAMAEQGISSSTTNASTEFSFQGAADPGTFFIDEQGAVTDLMGIFQGRVDPGVYPEGEYVVQDGQVGKVNSAGQLTPVADPSATFNPQQADPGAYYVDSNGDVKRLDDSAAGFILQNRNADGTIPNGALQAIGQLEGTPAGTTDQYGVSGVFFVLGDGSNFFVTEDLTAGTFYGADDISETEMPSVAEDIQNVEVVTDETGAPVTFIPQQAEPGGYFVDSNGNVMKLSDLVVENIAFNLNPDGTIPNGQLAEISGYNGTPVGTTDQFDGACVLIVLENGTNYFVTENQITGLFIGEKDTV